MGAREGKFPNVTLRLALLPAGSGVRRRWPGVGAIEGIFSRCDGARAGSWVASWRCVILTSAYVDTIRRLCHTLALHKVKCRSICPGAFTPTSRVTATVAASFV